ncbi:thioredoxin-dependent thiol peroxidase [Granulosicoccaceae sp. 1_MG-2023]|nr:thioredoxin-dependent thiol peroxidase [Granulosicoccaceae sp. 1_MG-2023]
MSELEVGKKVPDFSLPATGDQTISLTSLQGKNVVIYFYPKDSTPGCTTESQNFRDLSDEFAACNTVIIGVSRDGLKSHENFKAKQSLPFDLISDKEEELCKLFDVIKLKKLYGREYMGIERSTFLIDADGVLREEWRKVKVAGHAEAVLDAAKAL